MQMVEPFSLRDQDHFARTIHHLKPLFLLELVNTWAMMATQVRLGFLFS